MISTRDYNKGDKNIF